MLYTEQHRELMRSVEYPDGWFFVAAPALVFCH